MFILVYVWEIKNVDGVMEPELKNVKPATVAMITIAARAAIQEEVRSHVINVMAGAQQTRMHLEKWCEANHHLYV